MHGHGGWDGGWHWGLGFGHWLLGVLFWALVLVALVVLLRTWTRARDTGARAGQRTALEVLEERYARGEISRDEFERKRDDLRNH